MDTDMGTHADTDMDTHADTHADTHMVLNVVFVPRNSGGNGHVEIAMYHVYQQGSWEVQHAARMRRAKTSRDMFTLFGLLHGHRG